MLQGLWTSGRTIGFQPRWRVEITDALLLATTCGGLAWLMAGWWVGRLSARRAGRVGRRGLLLDACGSAALALGLTGGLSLGVLTSATLAWGAPGLLGTPAPLVLAELLWVWPRAVLLRSWLAGRAGTGRHLLELLEQSPATIQRRQAADTRGRTLGRAQLQGCWLAGFWVYLEIMLPTLLAPAGFLPAPMVLYNHLHYGQIGALGAKLVLLLAAAAGTWALLAAVARAAGRITRSR
jgi:hypothetical protein